MTDPQHEETFADTERKLREIITTLRAQLAVAEACNRGLVRLNEAIQARADRAEAALAAQIEVDAEICDGMQSSTMYYEAHECANAIRNQPRAGAAEHGSYDRTALDRRLTEAREVSEADKIAIRNKALREAADACDWGDIYGDNAVRTILALIDKEKSNDLP